MASLHQPLNARSHAQRTILLAGLVLIFLSGLLGCSPKGKTDATGSTGAVLPDSVQRCFDQFFLEAICQKEAGHADAAYDLMKQALRLNPNAAEANFEMSGLVRQLPAVTEDSSEASERYYLQKAVEQLPDNVDYLRKLGDCYLQESDYAAAAQIYERLLQKKYNEDLSTLLFLVYAYNDMPDSALRVADLIETHNGIDETSIQQHFYLYESMYTEDADNTLEKIHNYYLRDTTNRTLLLQTAQFFLSNGQRLPQARQMVEQGLRQWPADRELQILQLFIYSESADCEREYADLARTLILCPELTAEKKVALLQYLNEDTLHAEMVRGLQLPELTRQALELPQDGTELWKYYGSELLEQGVPEDSLVYIPEKMLEITPEDNALRLSCLQEALSKNQTDKALQLCLDGILYSPEELIYAYYGSLLTYQKGDHEAAASMLQHGLKVHSEDATISLLADAYGTLGDILHDLGRCEESYEAYDYSLMLAPSNAYYLNNYAYFLCLDGREMERAEEMIARAVAIEPQNASYLDTYAWIMYRKKDYAQAKTYIDEALKYQGEDESYTIWEHAGDIYSRCRLTNEAVRFWKKALPLADDEEAARTIRQKIKRRRVL